MVQFAGRMRALAAALAIAGASATAALADQAAKPYATITTVGLKSIPYDPCKTTCAGAAERERAKLGKAPAAPLYRFSATQAATTRANVIKTTAVRTGIAEAELRETIPAWDQSVIEWQDADPRDSYDLNDAADVFAKYWLFAWMFGGEVDLKAVTARMKDALRAQTHRLFASDPALAKLTEGERQALGDVMMLKLALDNRSLKTLSMGVILGQMDEEGWAATENDIVTHFESQFGLDLLRLSLTEDQGFVLRTSP